jgi:hypothetical protein
MDHNSRRWTRNNALTFNNTGNVTLLLEPLIPVDGASQGSVPSQFDEFEDLEENFSENADEEEDWFDVDDDDEDVEDELDEI